MAWFASRSNRYLFAIGRAIVQQAIAQGPAQGNVDRVLAVVGVQPDSESVIQHRYHNQESSS